MYLTKIDINGFKSFADKVTLTFAEGITAVLGPNGCGKSNVVDAVKWVLGESSAKQLRGTEMIDVIFAGSESRKPSGMAEVNLYFDNEDDFLPIEYNEVCITRRLYRSGESEYLINKQTCRKRDIRDLFMDTGIGTTAYSFIEQGKVEALLQAKPAERRAVFEEAAGISKYKQRRKETLARLERTNQYLDRANDRLEEVEKNIRRISRQASGARRFQRLTSELEAVKGFYFARQFRELQKILTRLEQERSEIDTLLADETNAQAALTQTIAHLTRQETETAAASQTHETEQLAVQESLAEVQVEAAAADERKQSLARELSEAEERAAAIQSRLAQLAQEAVALAENLTAQQAESSERETALTALDADRERIQTTLSTSETATEEITRERQIAQGDHSRAAGELARVESETAANQARTEQVDERLGSLSSDAGDAQSLVDALTTSARETGEALTALRQQIETLRDHETRLSDEQRHAAEALVNLQRERATRESRRATLADLEANLAGAFAGPKAIMNARTEGRAECAEVEGMIAELLTVPSEIALAIETILGGQAQDIIVTSARGAQTCIEFLKREQAGRATLLPLDRIRARRPLGRDFSDIAGVYGEAIQLVTFTDRFRPAMEYLLAGTLVVESLDRARELAAGEISGIRMVTLAGDVVSPHGAMTGGHAKGQRGGLITRKAEREELAVRIEELDRTITTATQADTERGAQLAELSVRRQAAQGEESTLAAKHQTTERDLSVQRSQIERLAPERNSLTSERERLVETRERLTNKQTALNTKQIELDRYIRTLSERFESAQQAQRENREALAALMEQLSAARERRAEAVANVREIETALERIAQTEAERKTELSRCHEIQIRATTEHETILANRDALEAREAELLAKRDAIKETGRVLRERLQNARERLQSEREAERARQKRLDEIVEAQNSLALQTRESDLRLEAINEKAQQELNITDLAAHANEIAAAEALAQRQQAATEAARHAVDETENTAPYQLAEAVVRETSAASDAGEEAASAPAYEPPSVAELASFSDAELEIHVEHLAGKIQRLDPVNTYAIDELKELEDKVSFQRTEQADLKKAADDLHEVIRRLNHECTHRFTATFEAVRENFQDLFRRLFGGGRADLILEEVNVAEGGDPLDAGIDIIAKPPGKEPTSIALLSGGEKALCAVALLFAIFRTKPSPFCILDEVDGPLDESNIARFMDAVRDFTSETQFILISHAKLTMSKTDRIHGITQSEPGVSTTYSLRFDEYETPKTPAAEAENKQLAHA